MRLYPFLFLCHFLFAFSLTLSAQTTNNTMLTGEFYLQGVREVGSGFQFRPDSSFEFFFSYGAVDRFGKGTFEQRGDSIILHSTPKPERDFILQSAKTTHDKKLVIKISDPNPMVLSYVVCRLETMDTVLQDQSDREGVILFDRAPVKSISLVHTLWPDRLSVFPVDHPEYNAFEFTIDPHIVEVDFNGIVLHKDGNTLSGPNPLLEPGKTYQFTSAR